MSDGRLVDVNVVVGGVPDCAIDREGPTGDCFDHEGSDGYLRVGAFAQEFDKRNGHSSFFVGGFERVAEARLQLTNMAFILSSTSHLNMRRLMFAAASHKVFLDIYKPSISKILL